jgi:hypothetical protein
MANGANAVAGLLWKKPKPLASSSGTRLRSVQSLSQHHQPDVAAGVGGGGADRHVAEHDADLGLVVEAPGRIVELDRRRAARAGRPPP